MAPFSTKIAAINLNRKIPCSTSLLLLCTADWPVPLFRKGHLFRPFHTSTRQPKRNAKKWNQCIIFHISYFHTVFTLYSSFWTDFGDQLKIQKIKVHIRPCWRRTRWRRGCSGRPWWRGTLWAAPCSALSSLCPSWETLRCGGRNHTWCPG